MLKKKYRVTNEKQFRLVYRNGIKVRGKFGMLIGYIPYFKDQSQKEKGIKFGFVVSKKLGDSVARHLLVRQLRSISHDILKADLSQNSREGSLEKTELLVNKNYWIVYVAFNKCEEFQALKTDYEQLFSILMKKLEFRPNI